jgi:hypothetical protein
MSWIALIFFISDASLFAQYQPNVLCSDLSDVIDVSNLDPIGDKALGGEIDNVIQFTDYFPINGFSAKYSSSEGNEDRSGVGPVDGFNFNRWYGFPIWDGISTIVYGYVKPGTSGHLYDLHHTMYKAENLTGKNNSNLYRIAQFAKTVFTFDNRKALFVADNDPKRFKSSELICAFTTARRICIVVTYRIVSSVFTVDTESITVFVFNKEDLSLETVYYPIPFGKSGSISNVLVPMAKAALSP